VKWYTLAAKKGYVEAQSSLATMYEYGEGVLTNYVRAYMWYNIAAYHDSEDGAKLKENIANKMTREQIAKAQEMSTRCLDSDYADC
jgi:TPR repeat protein